MWKSRVSVMVVVCVCVLWVGATGQPCPPTCSCLESVVDCAGPTALPASHLVPNWTRTLLVSGAQPSPDPRPFAQLGLRELRLEYCNYTSLPQVGSAPQLKVLSFAHNNIVTLQSKSLSGVTHLEELGLEQNHIERLRPDDLPHLDRLRTLRLSANRIQEVAAGAFAGLPHLADLRLNRNRIVSLPQGLFADQQHLENLDLSKNKLSEIDGLYFRKLSHLISLKLRHNKIESFKDGAFFGLKSITELKLDQNLISIISKTWMYGLNSLATLSISHNRLTTIDAGCWEWSEQLRELDLSGNLIRSIDAMTFEHLSNLKVLKLDTNKISSISENAFISMTALETLDLSHNRISWTVEDMNAPFYGLSRLHTLLLSHNHIKSVGDKAFLGLEGLNTLDFNGNNITSVHEQSFAVLPNLRILHMNTSGLLCDCDLKWFSLWLAPLPRQDNIKAVCAYPVRLRGKDLLSLNSESLTCNDSLKPRIFEHPKTKMVIKGETGRLHCKATSSSSSHIDFLWRRNDTNISNPNVKESTETVDDMMRVSSELILNNVSNSDAGRYQCIVSNIYGTTYSNKSHVTVVIFPKFIKNPANITVNAGDTAKLECSANGDPRPEVGWQKDGGNDFPAARERRMHVMPADYAFFIVHSKVSDMGVYSCTAQSIAGTIISNATLTVLEAPSFVNAMENKEITAGESVVIQCMVSGSPKPSLRWLKDGAPIMPTERHFFTAEDQLLIIVGAVSSDEGLYECEITNALGVVKDSTELRVLQPIVISTSNTDEDMMGIIIITVVCCAVGTSIVWVFIIYQTRRRMNSALPQFSPDSLQLAPISTEVELTSPHLFGDNISERSSCKDSGTGDSAKRSSLEVNPADELQQIGAANIVPVYVNPSHDESRMLLKKDDNIKAFYSDDCEHSVTVQMHMADELMSEHSASRTYPYS
ncbi:leucine-rich repeats and immunoglobulin-like domains protein lambik [Arctopsyche grandis]|uniref:leucine-rich repeats and immunoglobulin-like domains protein lambik n=1 Tax=Arctopsyche grandis TaxID=121162 RepID=UPI00406DA1BE